MATETKRARPGETFISKAQMAREIGVDTQTIDKWVASRSFPPPHSQPGERTALWLRTHFDHYVSHRRWPDSSFAP